MQTKSFMSEMIRSELEDAVGIENVSLSHAEKTAYGTDYFWVSRMWMDKGQTPPHPRLYRSSRQCRGGFQGSENRQLL